MTVSATVIGKVQEVKEFGEAVKLTLVHIEGKESGYQSQYFDIIAKKDSWQGKLILGLKKDDDDIAVVGSLKKEPWKNNPDRFTMIIKFPSEIRVPWALRDRDKAAVSAGSTMGTGKGLSNLKLNPKKPLFKKVETEQETEDDGLDDIPF